MSRFAPPTESRAAWVLSATALVAVVWASVWHRSYQQLTHASLPSHWFHGVALTNVHDVVLNGGLTIFFVAVGFEVAREWRRHERHPQAVAAAMGGMALPALFCLLLGSWWHLPALRHAWGVPMATDIAFALAIVALAGRGLPRAVRIFVLTLAVADDVLSVLVLAVTGVTAVRLAGVVVAGLLLIAGTALAVVRSDRRLWALWGFALWAALLYAHVDAPLAGVVVGLAASGPPDQLLAREERLSQWSQNVVLPLFTFVVLGVSLSTSLLHGANGGLIVGLVLARILGKVLGIAGGAWLFRRRSSLGGATVLALGLVCAVGFTVPSLFALAAFPATTPAYRATITALLGASVMGAVAGSVALRRLTRATDPRGS